MRKILIQKIDELNDFAESIGEKNTQIILLVLSASILIDSDYQLAKKVQEYAKDVLLPEIKAGKINEIAIKN